VALAGRAAAADGAEYRSILAHFQFVRGLADYRQGRFDEAVKVLQGGPSRLTGPSTRLVLAMALYRGGRQEEAQELLQSAVQRHDWRPNEARNQDGWIAHILRREAEALIRPASPEDGS
jgi:serine/threonine-protein kinase